MHHATTTGVAADVRAVCYDRLAAILETRPYRSPVREDCWRKSSAEYYRSSRWESSRRTLRSYPPRRVSRRWGYSGLDNNQSLYCNERRRVRHVLGLLGRVHSTTNCNRCDEDPRASGTIDSQDQCNRKLLWQSEYPTDRRQDWNSYWRRIGKSCPNPGESLECSYSLARSTTKRGRALDEQTCYLQGRTFCRIEPGIPPGIRIATEMASFHCWNPFSPGAGVRENRMVVSSPRNQKHSGEQLLEEEEGEKTE